jgi:hypothetical protein
MDHQVLVEEPGEFSDPALVVEGLQVLPVELAGLLGVDGVLSGVGSERPYPDVLC